MWIKDWMCTRVFPTIPENYSVPVCREQFPVRFPLSVRMIFATDFLDSLLKSIGDGRNAIVHAIDTFCRLASGVGNSGHITMLS